VREHSAHTQGRSCVQSETLAALYCEPPCVHSATPPWKALRASVLTSGNTQYSLFRHHCRCGPHADPARSLPATLRAPLTHRFIAISVEDLQHLLPVGVVYDADLIDVDITATVSIHHLEDAGAAFCFLIIKPSHRAQLARNHRDGARSTQRRAGFAIQALDARTRSPQGRCESTWFRTNSLHFPRYRE